MYPPRFLICVIKQQVITNVASAAYWPGFLPAVQSRAEGWRGELYLKTSLKAQLSSALGCDSGGLSVFIIKLGYMASSTLADTFVWRRRGRRRIVIPELIKQAGKAEKKHTHTHKK